MWESQVSLGVAEVSGNHQVHGLVCPIVGGLEASHHGHGPIAHTDNMLLIKWLLGQIKDTHLMRLNFAVTWSKGSFWNSDLRPWSRQVHFADFT